MDSQMQLKHLKGALIIFGLFFIFGIYPLMVVWPSGWQWTPNQHEYEQMIIGIYATLGAFLLLASRNPLENRSLIWFTVWSSVVHAGIMAYQAAIDPLEYGHFIGDIPALFLVAVVFAILMPRKKQI